MPRRFVVKQDRPDLCQRAAEDLGLTDPRAHRFDGAWLVSGWDKHTLRVFHFSSTEDWEEIVNNHSDGESQKSVS
jgi:hypothetical protein